MKKAIAWAAVALLAGCSRPAPQTYDEVLGRLADGGFPHQVVERSAGGRGGPPSVLIRPAGPIPDEELQNFHWGRPWSVTITLEESAHVARDKAGALGEGGHASGRFLFTSRPEHIRAVREALR